MRRLYSTFASGWPGAGLLFLRLVLGCILVLRGGGKQWGGAPLHTAVGSALLAGAGVLLIVGLWTPLAGATVAALAIFEALAIATDRTVHLLVATIGAALAMLGPGRWSVDARLFGWKRIEAPRSANRPTEP